MKFIRFFVLGISGNRRPLYTLFLGALLLILAACGSGGGTGTGGVSAPDTTVASVKITPGGVLFTGSGETRALSVTTYNAAGQVISASATAAASPITWASNKSADVSVDANGLLTSNISLGSALITASVNGITSPPLLITIANPVSGAVLVNDTQVVGDLRPADPTAPLTVGSLYDVTLIGITAPVVGDILIGTGSALVAGRVTAVSGGSGTVNVTLELVPIGALFTSYEINENLPISVANAEVKPEISDMYDIVRNANGSLTFTPNSNITTSVRATVNQQVTLGPFECKTSLSVFPLSVSNYPTYSIKLSSTKYPNDLNYIINLSSGFVDKKLAVKGKIMAVATSRWDITSSMEGTVTCEVQFFEVPIPVSGWLSFFVGGYVPIGLGMEVGGKLALTGLSFEANGEAGGTIELGVSCPAGLSCSAIKTFSPEATFSTKWTVPSTVSNALRLAPSLSVSGFANLEFGLKAPKDARLQVLAFKAGPVMSGTLAFVDGQIEDPLFTADYALDIEVALGPGSSITKAMELLDLNMSGVITPYVIPVDKSPKSTSIMADASSFVAGDSVSFNVKLDPARIEFLTVYNIKEVQIYRKTVDLFGVVSSVLVGSNIATDGQADFTIAWTADYSGSVTDGFYAFVVTKFLPFAYFDKLELGKVTTTGTTTTGKIAILSHKNGSSTELYVMNADGTGQTRLTNLVGWYPFSATWSQDGTKIAFMSNRDGNEEIYVMNADGTGQTNLTNNPARDRQPAWSQDGTKIAFISNDGLYVMNADGTNRTSLTSRYSLTPAWSPDGTKIAFKYGSGIYVMNADGTNNTRLPNTGSYDYAPVWSPDGTKIAVTWIRFSYTPAFYVMNADGTNRTNLTNNAVSPVWSPDGTKIAFMSNRDGNYEIYVMNADGTNQTNLTNNAAHYPAWSQDGTKIAFTSYRNGYRVIYVMNADGTNQTRLTAIFPLTQITNLVWLP